MTLGTALQAGQHSALIRTESVARAVRCMSSTRHWFLQFGVKVPDQTPVDWRPGHASSAGATVGESLQRLAMAAFEHYVLEGSEVRGSW